MEEEGLTGVLSAAAMGVLFDAVDQRVDCDQDGENACQDRLHDYEDYAGNRLGRLADSQLFDKDQDTDDGQDAHDLDDDVDDVAASEVVWSRPDQETEENDFDRHLTDGLHHTVAVGACDDGVAREHVDD